MRNGCKPEKKVEQLEEIRMFKQEEQIEQKLVEALKARNDLKIGAYRLIKAAIKNERIERGKEFSETDLVKVLKRELKKRREAAEAFKKGGREELADKELAEAEIIKEFLPEELSEEKVIEVIQAVIKEQGFSGPENFGQAMNEVMVKLAGQADGSLVSKLLKEELAK